MAVGLPIVLVTVAVDLQSDRCGRCGRCVLADMITGRCFDQPNDPDSVGARCGGRMSDRSLRGARRGGRNSIRGLRDSIRGLRDSIRGLRDSIRGLRVRGLHVGRKTLKRGEHVRHCVCRGAHPSTQRSFAGESCTGGPLDHHAGDTSLRQQSVHDIVVCPEQRVISNVFVRNVVGGPGVWHVHRVARSTGIEQVRRDVDLALLEVLQPAADFGALNAASRLSEEVPGFMCLIRRQNQLRCLIRRQNQLRPFLGEWCLTWRIRRLSTQTQVRIGGRLRCWIH